jgi:hypothetical protein
MACEEYYDTYQEAKEAYERAKMATESADDNLDAAWWAYVGGLAGEIGCGLLVETIIGFIFCEAVAVSGAVSGAKWVDSAEKALLLAELAEEDAEDAFGEALGAWCDCLRKGGSK